MHIWHTAFLEKINTPGYTLIKISTIFNFHVFFDFLEFWNKSVAGAPTPLGELRPRKKTTYIQL